MIRMLFLVNKFVARRLNLKYNKATRLSNHNDVFLNFIFSANYLSGSSTCSLNSLLKHPSATATSCTFPLQMSSKYFNSNNIVIISVCDSEGTFKSVERRIASLHLPHCMLEKKLSAVANMIFSPDSSSSFNAVSLGGI